MIRKQAVNRRRVDRRIDDRVNHGGLDAASAKGFRRRFRKTVGVSETDQSNLTSALCNLVADGLSGVDRRTVLRERAGNMDNNGRLRLFDRPVKKRQIIVDITRGKCHDSGDVRKKRTDLRAVVRRVSGPDAGAEHKNHGRILVEGKVLHQLVIGSLQERSVHHEDRLRAALCHTGNHCNRVLFRNSDVDKLFAHAVTPCLVHSEGGRSCRVDNADRRVRRGLSFQKLAGIVVTALVA